MRKWNENAFNIYLYISVFLQKLLFLLLLFPVEHYSIVDKSTRGFYRFDEIFLRQLSMCVCWIKFGFSHIHTPPKIARSIHRVLLLGISLLRMDYYFFKRILKRPFDFFLKCFALHLPYACSSLTRLCSSYEHGNIMTSLNFLASGKWFEKAKMIIHLTRIKMMPCIFSN